MKATLKSGDEVRVEMREEHVRDAQLVRVDERQILIDVALRIDDRGDATFLIADDIRGVRKTVQIKLMKDHGLSVTIRAL